MKEQFVSYKIALALKEKGFEEYCFSAYRNTDGEESLLSLSKWRNGEPYDNHPEWCAAPLWQQVVDWFIEKYNLSIEVSFINIISMGAYGWSYQIIYASKERPLPCDLGSFLPQFDTRKEALEFSINEALKLI